MIYTSYRMRIVRRITACCSRVTWLCGITVLGWVSGICPGPARGQVPEGTGGGRVPQEMGGGRVPQETGGGRVPQETGGGRVPWKMDGGRVAGGEWRVMWYNVENLFHPEDDPGEGDDAFTPAGLMHWTYGRYRKKLTLLAKVIVAAGQGEPPCLVGLAEVENEGVLADLVAHPILAPYRYRFIQREGPDHRGMDVACLYREGRIHLAGWEFVPPVPSEDFGDTREMIHLWGSPGGKDSLDLILVHFISRYRGAGSTADYRRSQSRQLVRFADSLRLRRPGSLLLAAGDFNEPWGGYSLKPLGGSTLQGHAFVPVPWTGPGSSYKYRGRWSGIDLFLVAGQNGHGCLQARVFRLPVLLETDGQYGGRMPRRTYRGYSYHGGLSDHLPILLDVSR
jgi:hypothetical protein